MRFCKKIYLKQIWKVHKHENVHIALYALRVLVMLIAVMTAFNFLTTDILDADTPEIVRSITDIAHILGWFCVSAFSVFTICILREIPDLALEEAALQDPIPANHGDSIAEVLYNIRKEPVEYLATFESDGTKHEEATRLHPFIVQQTDDCWLHLRAHRRHNHVQLHNHPHGFTAFSPDDIGSAIDGRIRKSIVIAGHMVYTMKLTDENWKLSGDEVKEAYAKVIDDPAFFYSRWLGRKLNSRKFKAQRSIAACHCLAQIFGFSFTSEPYKKSQYYRDYLRLKYGKAPATTPSTVPSHAEATASDRSALYRKISTKRK